MSLFNTSSSVTSNNFNYLVTGGVTTGTPPESYMVRGWKIRYTGAAWEAQATYGNSQEAATLVFDYDSAVADTLKITLTGLSTQFALPPAVVVSAAAGDALYNVKSSASSATIVLVKFYAVADGALITTAADTNMSFNMLLFGAIG